MPNSILIMNGPNLNRLGLREPEIYGHESLDKLNHRLREYAAERHVSAEFLQSNHEGVLIDAIHASDQLHQGIILNPGGFAHTSVALRDAIASISIPVVEVHISDVYSREEFRHTMLLSEVCNAVFGGHGTKGYFLALDHLLSLK